MLLQDVPAIKGLASDQKDWYCSTETEAPLDSAEVSRLYNFIYMNRFQFWFTQNPMPLFPGNQVLQKAQRNRTTLKQRPKLDSEFEKMLLQSYPYGNPIPQLDMSATSWRILEESKQEHTQRICGISSKNPKLPPEVGKHCIRECKKISKKIDRNFAELCSFSPRPLGYDTNANTNLTCRSPEQKSKRWDSTC